ncbi:DUF2023 family protein [Bacteroides sp.]|uniref:DUF2023 family protein n=1 Tax=Bacteroides sp. TaxID=29523 RepID=UPI0025882DDF|nr:DUF2023 family protein [Bacteroides sp.]
MHQSILYTPPAEIRIFLNHVYEFKKGVRRMVLYTLSKEYEPFVKQRLEGQGISYFIQEVSSTKINLFFGHALCMEAVKRVVTVPLNELSPEQDFILGALLGYDLCQQCERFCSKKEEHTSILAVY